MSLRTTAFRSVRVRSGLALALIIIVALVAFEMFNYSTTEYALSDLLGGLLFAGIHWSTILSIAFCGIDFAGIARLFVPEAAAKEPREAWYLFAAWLLAATMNAILTWWGVSMAVVNHTVRSIAIVDTSTLTHIVPVFVAVMVLVIRILIIGTLSMAIGRISSIETRPSVPAWTRPGAISHSTATRTQAAPRPASYNRSYNPANNEEEEDGSETGGRLEPTYQPLMARPHGAPESRSAGEPSIRPARKF
jgi:hypothetical protein